MQPTQNRYKYLDENKEHLHTLDGRPLYGTSTAMKVIAKPLTWWASGLAMNKMGWTNSKKKNGKKYESIPLDERIKTCEPVLEKIKNMSVEDYLKLCDDAYKAHSVVLEDSADAGTDLHKELENFVKMHMNEREHATAVMFSKRLEPFIAWTEKNVKNFLWSEAHCYSEVHWIGGISDAGVELNDGSIAIIDFKSSKEAYASQFFQAGGYNLAITENGLFDKDGNFKFKLEKPITKHIIVPFGAPVVVPDVVEGARVETDKEAFKHALGLYKIMNMLEAI